MMGLSLMTYKTRIARTMAKGALSARLRKVLTLVRKAKRAKEMKVTSRTKDVKDFAKGNSRWVVRKSMMSSRMVIISS